MQLYTADLSEYPETQYPPLGENYGNINVAIICHYEEASGVEDILINL